MKTLTKIAAGCALLASSVAAFAAPITGSIGFGFSITPEDGANNTVALGSATHLDINNDKANVTVVEAGTVLSSIFTYNAINNNYGNVDYFDFDINPFTPVSPLWSGSGVSFELLTMTIDQQDNNDLDLSGTGIMSLAGYEDTNYTWSFSADTTGAVFAASSTNAPVSESSTVALFGLGLVGLGLAARKRKSA